MSTTGTLLFRTARDSGMVLMVPAVAWALAAGAPDTYESLVQEDGPVEWITFWAFLAAGILALTSPWLRRRDGRPVSGPLTGPFLVLFGLGTLLIALEEISWGQRLLGYRPPQIFLTDNFQQELNLHNVADPDARGYLLLTLITTFGIVYPLLCRLPITAAWLKRLGVPDRPLSSMPAFLVLVGLYAAYPWGFTGEWVELGAGIGFLEAAVGYRADPRPTGWAAVGAVVLAGLLTAAGQATFSDPGSTELARIESQALADDFATKRYRSRCGVHKRVYTFVAEYGGVPVEATSFGRLPGTDRDAERRRYFLDPWNLPYWIRHTCSADRQASTVVVYSFGANRRRESTGVELNGDDVGAYVTRPRSR